LMDEHAITMDGSAHEESSRLESAGSSIIFVAVDGRIAGVIGVEDAIKPAARRAVDSLHRAGLRVIMMTGDNQRAAARVAAAVGVREYHGGARPEDKLDLVRTLQAEGLAVAMVGDGVNDTPAL